MPTARDARTLLRRPEWLVACALFAAAGVLSTSPAVRDVRSAFMAEGLAARAGTAPGDHLQSAYRLWLPGHQLERGARPWVDPYSFQPVAEQQENFAAWPFGLPFWPLQRALGTVGAWNAFVLLSYVLAGVLAYGWIVSLGVSRWAAAVGGLVFALAPYRAAQLSAGHLLAPVSALLPGALWALERRRVALAAALIASIPFSGQVHVALGAIPFFLAYAALRSRARIGVVGATVAVAAGLVVYVASIRGSVGAGGRSFAQVERYSAELADFVSRDVRHGIESYVFLGWLVPLLAVAGLVLVTTRRRRLAVALGAGAFIPVLAALGANTPLYEPLWRHVPGLEETRVPGRLMPIASLSVAALAAFAVDRARRPVAALAAIALVALDLRLGVELFRPAPAAEGVYSALAEAPPGRVLDLPVFLPDQQEASVYVYGTIVAPRERVLGYSTTASPEADALARRLRRDPCDERLLRSLGVASVITHPGAPDCAHRWPVVARSMAMSLRRVGAP